MEKERKSGGGGEKDGGRQREITSGSMKADIQQRSLRESSYKRMVGWSQQVNVEGLVLQGKHWPLA